MRLLVSLRSCSSTSVSARGNMVKKFQKITFYGNFEKKERASFPIGKRRERLSYFLFWHLPLSYFGVSSLLFDDFPFLVTAFSSLSFFRFSLPGLGYRRFTIRSDRKRSLPQGNKQTNKNFKKITKKEKMRSITKNRTLVSVFPFLVIFCNFFFCLGCCDGHSDALLCA